MGRKKKLLVQVGVTADGQPAYAGVYRFSETEGIDLSTILMLGILPAWEHYYDEALKACMKHNRIISRLSSAIPDAYGREFRDVVVGRLAVRNEIA